MPKPIKYTLFTFFTIMLTVTTFVFLIIDKKPDVNSVKTLTSDSAEQTKKILNKVYLSFSEAVEPSVLNLTFEREDLSSLSAAIHHILPSLSTRFRLFEDSTQVVLSYKIADSDFYLNISTLILKSDEGLALGQVNIGDMSFGGQGLINFTTWVLNRFVKESLGNSLFSVITRIDNDHQKISISYQLPTTEEGQDNGSIFVALRDKLSPFGDVDNVQYYLDELLDFASISDSKQLIDYVTFVITTAHEYPLVHDDAANQNYSALMALVLYFGHDKFEMLVGDFKPLSDEDRLVRNHNREHVVFGERVDFQKHFIYSIALQLFVNDKTSNALGVFKELLDANSGGSGFSFADLLADRVGTSLAVTATKNNHQALYVQKQFALLGIAESDILPEFSDLPEGIAKNVFQQHYIDIKSIPYNQMLLKINQRLFAAPLFNGLSSLKAH